MAEPSKQVTQEEVVQKYGEKLEGHTLVLDPKQSGMFVDKDNDINLHFFADGHDRVAFDKKMNPLNIVKGIRNGLLRVYKDDKDVTGYFGGPQKDDEWNRKPVVEDIVKREVDDSDKPLLALLGRNIEKEIIRDIENVKDYGMLKRLKELEGMGKNPSSSGRVNVLNVIAKAMKTTSGVIEAGKIEGKEEVVSAR